MGSDGVRQLNLDHEVTLLHKLFSSRINGSICLIYKSKNGYSNYRLAILSLSKVCEFEHVSMEFEH